MQTSLTVLIADDHAIFRKGLQHIFNLIDRYSFRFLEASNGRDAVRLALCESVDIILLDESMPELKGYDAAKTILFNKPSSKIIALTNYDEMALILNYFKIGIKGFLTKDVDCCKISDAIRTVLNGDFYCASRFEDEIFTYLATGLTRNIPAIRFSNREAELILHISQGKTNKEIAEKLAISQRTIEAYRYSLIDKIGVNNSAELLSYIYKNGIL